MVSFALIIFHLVSNLFFLPDWNEQDPSSGKLIIYRKADFGNQFFYLKINDQIVLKDYYGKTYLEISVPSGELILETGGNMFTEKKKFKMMVEKDQTYFLEGIVSYEFRSSSLYLVNRSATDFEGALSKITKDNRAQNIYP